MNKTISRGRVGTCMLLLAAFSGSAQSQQFQEATSLLGSTQSLIARPVSGGSVIDFNVDGLMDVYREGLLLQQMPDGRFVNVQPSSGLDDLVGRTEGGVWADYDSDGYPDLFLIDRAQAPRLFRNTGRGLFLRADRVMNLDEIPAIRGAVWMEADGDGNPDLVVTGASGLRVYENNTPANFIWRSDIPTGAACSVSTVDYSGDGRSDLYLGGCDDGILQLDQFLRARGSGRFDPDPAVIPLTNGRLARGTVTIDYDRDGDLDIFVANEIPEPIEFPETSADRLYRNEGNGTFSPIPNSGLSGDTNDQAWGVAAADFDNDGWVDILVTNRLAVDTSLPNYRFFRNQGNGTFSPWPNSGLPLDEPEDYGVPLVGDLNGDGNVDVYLASGAGDRLFYNQGAGNHWLKIRLRGLIPANDTFNEGLGARILVWSGGSVQAGQIESGTGHASHHHGLAAHFGLGAATTADSVIVYWNGGAVDRLVGVAADQEIIIKEEDGFAPVAGTFGLIAPADGQRIDLSDGTIEFAWEGLVDPSGGPVTYELLLAGPGLETSYTILGETSFTLDPVSLLQNQTYFWTVAARTRYGVRSSTGRRAFKFGGSTVAAPVKLSMPLVALNRGQMAFSDFDHDGDLDLAVTGTRGTSGETRFYAAVDSLFPVGETDQSFKLFRDTRSILRKVLDGHLSWVDYDMDGDEDLFLAGYFRDIDGEVSIVSEFYVNAGILAQNSVIGAQIPGVHQGDGAWADVDGDGDLDLLLSGATSPGEPFTTMADVFRNDAGTFQPMNLGFRGARFARVSWADYDSDGDPDAFISGQDDAGSPFSAAYRNDGATFTPVDLGLPALQFGSMDWADYDGDSDLDLVVTGGELSPDLFSGQTIVYRNDGGVLTDVGAGRDLAQIVFGAAHWLDFDEDGDQDLLLSGVENPFGERIALIYRNEDNIRFAEEFRLTGLLFAAVAAGDYNGDGDTDFVVIGEDAEGEASVLFFLNLVVPESIPAALIQR